MLPAASAGAELPRGDRQREVPRRDQPDHADRLAHGEGLPAGDRDRVAEQPLGRAGVVAEGVPHHLHLAAGVGDRLAGVARLEHGQLLGVGRDVLGDRLQDARAGAGVERAPRGQRRARSGDGRVDVLDVSARDFGEHRLGGGLEHSKRWRSAVSPSALCGPSATPARQSLRPYGDSAIAGSACSMSSSSIVRIGPLKVFFADTKYQIVTPAITAIVTSGA